MKMLLLLLTSLSLPTLAQTLPCADLNGVYEVKAKDCDGEIAPELSLPSQQGLVPLAHGSRVSLQQKNCEQIDISLNEDSSQRKSLRLQNAAPLDVFPSNYGFIIQQELKKQKACPSYYKKGKCSKFNISTQWNIESTGDGNLVLKMYQEVKRVGVFRLARKVKQICSLERLN